MAGKITDDMSMLEVLMVMSEGNPGALTVLVSMLEGSPMGFSDILMLDGMDIRGVKVYMLGNDCCGRDMSKLSRTLSMIRGGVFTKEQIHANLERCRALPFIDDSIEMDGVPPYGEFFGPGHPLWDDWCSVQKESYEQHVIVA